MGQLLLILIVPPVVGVVTYTIFRIFSRNNKDGEAMNWHAHDPAMSDH